MSEINPKNETPKKSCLQSCRSAALERVKQINDDRMSTIASFWSSIQPKGSFKYPTLENCAPHYSRLLRLGIIMTGKKC